MTGAVEAHSQRLDHAALRLARPTEAIARRHRQLAGLAHRLAVAGHRRLEGSRAAVGQSMRRLSRATRVCLEAHEARLAARTDRLQSLDPLRVLARGYALLTDRTGHAIVSVGEVDVGTALHATVGDGTLGVAVTSLAPGDDVALPAMPPARAQRP
jgi:exodeoxyribonuclease VII large subunit